jgi:hypothetical protein
VHAQQTMGRRAKRLAPFDAARAVHGGAAAPAALLAGSAVLARLQRAASAGDPPDHSARAQAGSRAGRKTARGRLQRLAATDCPPRARAHAPPQ